MVANMEGCHCQLIVLTDAVDDLKGRGFTKSRHPLTFATTRLFIRWFVRTVVSVFCQRFLHGVCLCFLFFNAQ